VLDAYLKKMLKVKQKQQQMQQQKVQQKVQQRQQEQQQHRQQRQQQQQQQTSAALGPGAVVPIAIPTASVLSTTPIDTQSPAAAPPLHCQQH